MYNDIIYWFYIFFFLCQFYVLNFPSTVNFTISRLSLNLHFSQFSLERQLLARQKNEILFKKILTNLSNRFSKDFINKD